MVTKLLSDDMIKREAILILYKIKLVYDYTDICNIQHDAKTGKDILSIKYKNKHVDIEIKINERKLSLDDFANRILVPMIARLEKEINPLKFDRD